MMSKSETTGELDREEFLQRLADAYGLDVDISAWYEVDLEAEDDEDEGPALTDRAKLYTVSITLDREHYGFEIQHTILEEYVEDVETQERIFKETAISMFSSMFRRMFENGALP